MEQTRPDVSAEFTTFGPFLKYLRRRVQLTQAELGIACGYTASYISHIENNQRLPDQATLLARFIPALDLEDKPELVARLLELANAARKGQLTDTDSPVVVAAKHPNNLPVQITSFIGRESELAALAQRLDDPAIRLVTILGPGGIGKTRLAIEVAAAQLDRHLHGIFFAVLQPVTSPDFILSVIAESLNFQFYPGGDPKQQLLDYCREKSLLLVLDNAEHVLDGLGFISDMLAYAPGVKVLVTSRERLNLREEWVFDLRGLNFPASDSDTSGIQDYSAVQLFVQNAQQVQNRFRLGDSQKAAISRICRTVGGMPLALELAAAWVRALSCEAIADAIERDMDILETSVRNVLPRHRSMRSVMDHSWTLLSSTEQNVFQQLSVFRGGFTPEAAQAVTGTSLRLLAALVDKSMLSCDPLGRYDIHELLRQYAEKQLDALPEESVATHERHCDYYADFMEQREFDLYEGKSATSQRDAFARIAREIGNVRAAFRWATDTVRLQAIRKFTFSLWLFLQIRGRHQEGKEVFGWALECLRKPGAELNEARQRVLSECLTRQGFFALYSADVEGALQLAQESEVLWRTLPLETTRVSTIAPLILLSNLTSDSPKAKQLVEEACQVSRQFQREQIWGTLSPIQVLAQLNFAQGCYEEAKRLAQEAASICRKINDHIIRPFALLDLSNIALAQGEYQEAQQCAREALASAEEINYQYMILRAKRGLGHIALMDGRYKEAQHYYQESLRASQDIGNVWGIASAYRSLGDVASKQANYPEAQAYYAKALQLAEQGQTLPEMLHTVGRIAELIAYQGQRELAIELTTLVLNHPASGQNTKDQVEAINPRLQIENLRGRLQTALTPAIFTAAEARGKVRDLHATVRGLLLELGHPE